MILGQKTTFRTIQVTCKTTGTGMLTDWFPKVTQYSGRCKVDDRVREGGGWIILCSRGLPLIRWWMVRRNIRGSTIGRSVLRYPFVREVVER